MKISVNDGTEARRKTASSARKPTASTSTTKKRATAAAPSKKAKSKSDAKPANATKPSKSSKPSSKPASKPLTTTGPGKLASTAPTATKVPPHPQPPKPVYPPYYYTSTAPSSQPSRRKSVAAPAKKIPITSGAPPKPSAGPDGQPSTSPGQAEANAMATTARSSVSGGDRLRPLTTVQPRSTAPEQPATSTTEDQDPQPEAAAPDRVLGSDDTQMPQLPPEASPALAAPTAEESPAPDHSTTPTAAAAADAQPSAVPPVKAVEITLHLPELPAWRPLLHKTRHGLVIVRRRIAASSRRTRLIAAALSLLAVLLIGGIKIWNNHHPYLSDAPADPSVSRAAALKKGDPSFHTVIPAGKNIADLGGWTTDQPSGAGPGLCLRRHHRHHAHKCQRAAIAQRLPKEHCQRGSPARQGVQRQ